MKVSSKGFKRGEKKVTCRVSGVRMASDFSSSVTLENNFQAKILLSLSNKDKQMTLSYLQTLKIFTFRVAFLRIFGRVCCYVQLGKQ